jgi:hypothetical protein
MFYPVAGGKTRELIIQEGAFAAVAVSPNRILPQPIGDPARVLRLFATLVGSLAYEYQIRTARFSPQFDGCPRGNPPMPHGTHQITIK